MLWTNQNCYTSVGCKNQWVEPQSESFRKRITGKIWLKRFVNHSWIGHLYYRTDVKLLMNNDLWNLKIKMGIFNTQKESYDFRRLEIYTCIILSKIFFSQLREQVLSPFIILKRLKKKSKQWHHLKVYVPLRRQLELKRPTCSEQPM